MTDIAIAKENLEEHSICLCKDGEYFTDDGRGISPMLRFITEGRDLRGYSVADVIVGKAAAILFTKAEVAAVHGTVTSSAAYSYLTQRGIPCSYDTLAERIINRAGDDICPMEKTVADIEDENEGYRALCARIQQMRSRGTEENNG